MGTLNTTGNAPTYKSAAPGGVHNLTHSYQSKFDERFAKKSYTEPFCGNAYSWNNDHSISIFTLGDGVLKDYDLTQNVGSRFGAMHEINDEINTYELKQVFAIRETYERVYNDDQRNIRNTQYILKNIIDNKLKPAIDMYRLKTWANGAGNTKVLSTALSKSNIVETLLKANAFLDNLDVPEDGRVFFMGITDAIMVNLADELKYQAKWTEKGAVRGEVNMLGGAKIVQLPDRYMPAGVSIMMKWKGSTVDPSKLHWIKRYDNVEGYSGPVLNGLFRYDSFVLAQKANGIYCIGNYGNTTLLDASAMTLSVNSSTGVVTASNAPASATLKCTVDKRNPKIADNKNTITLVSGTSTIASTGSPTLLVPDGGIVRVYAEKTNCTNSGIMNYKWNATAKTLTAVTDFDI